MPEELQIRIHGEASQPALIYLPGTHGDWTVVGGLRRALAGRVRFVEFTYPRTLEWPLEDYAAAIEAALHEKGIHHGWLLGESFGSQVLWAISARKRFQIEGVILAGSFARHPFPVMARIARGIMGALPLPLFVGLLALYAKISRFRFQHSPETQADFREFIGRRTELDRQAMRHRLRLVAESDLRRVASAVEMPVFALTGALDPIVPWMFVRAWLRRHCAALREYRVLWFGDHPVLCSQPAKAAELVVKWMGV